LPGSDGRFVPTLRAALAAGDVAAVLIWTDAVDAGIALPAVEPLVTAAQAAGAAALVRGDTRLVGRAKADGFHADGTFDELATAITDLAPARIVGAGNLRSRDDAMIAGEAGADYVFFGNLSPGATTGNGRDLLLERAEWWQALFEVPCVVMASTLDDVGPLARAGADFVALRDAIWNAPAGPAAAVQTAEAAIATAMIEVAA
jgi:thiamine-phosphate pyrophosphorylase